nr:alpha/beta fold hydrolase [Nocardioides zeae]
MVLAARHLDPCRAAPLVGRPTREPPRTRRLPPHPPHRAGRPARDGWRLRAGGPRASRLRGDRRDRGLHAERLPRPQRHRLPAQPRGGHAHRPGPARRARRRRGDADRAGGHAGPPRAERRGRAGGRARRRHGRPGRLIAPASPASPASPVSLVCLHALGGSARSFDALASEVGPAAQVVALDLPGFGDSTGPGGDCAATVRHVADRLAALSRAPGPLVLLGHSMGGKIATLLAAGAVVAPPADLAAVVLVAASPVVPEPMGEDRRRQMLAWTRDGALDRAAAEEFVAMNTQDPLPADLHETAVADLRRTDPIAWRRWLLAGSREDWSARVPRLDVPALVVSGAGDGDLGTAAQRDLNGGVAHDTELVEVDGAAHLVPQERPAALAAAVAGLVDRLG